MGFETRFENGERVSVTDVWWVVVPEVGSRAAEGSRSNGGQVGGRNSELDGRR